MFDLQISDNRHLQEWFNEACDDYDTYLAEQLLSIGADINLVDIDDSYPLSRACAAGDENMVRFLLALGADVNNTSLALSEACRQEDGSVDVLIMLLDAGANLSFWLFDYNHPLMAAYECGNLEATQIVLESYKCSPQLGFCCGICYACSDSSAVPRYLYSIMVHTSTTNVNLHSYATPRIPMYMK